jgi:hypothetical protein
MAQGSLNHSKILFLIEIINQTLLFFNNTKIITAGKIILLKYQNKFLMHQNTTGHL